MKISINHECLADLHTHTIFSLHGTASPYEMHQAACKLGLQYLAMTDHVYDYTDKFQNLNAVSRACEMFFTKVLPGETTIIPGGEYNLFANNELIDHPDGLKLIGLHSWWYREDANPQNFSLDDVMVEYERQFNTHEGIHIAAHPERGLYGVCTYSYTEMDKYLENLVDLCCSKGVIVEVNTEKIWMNDEQGIIKLRNFINNILEQFATDNRLVISLGSDAHSPQMIGKGFDEVLKEMSNRLRKHVINIDPRKMEELMEQISPAT